MASRLYTNCNANNSVNRPRWRCTKCSKTLSSKRSYDEHMNVHNGRRPFACDECEYSAASQMTLRRHKLRSHIPRTSWGYHCPHCVESYMEPASYQQHVSSRHTGLSATFGCTFCNFSTKSSKHFREHIGKHLHVRARHSGEKIDAVAINVTEFLIDDENGRGYFSLNRDPEPIQSSINSKLSILECDDYWKTPLEPKTKQRPPKMRPAKMEEIYESRMEIPEVQSEVIIDETESRELPMQGELNDFDLD